jgi:hypothetical protein
VRERGKERQLLDEGPRRTAQQEPGGKVERLVDTDVEGGTAGEHPATDAVA